MAGNADVVDIFECEGSFSFLREAHRFTFTIHSDSSLRVDVKSVAAATLVEPIAVDLERPARGTIEDIDDMGGEEDGNVREDVVQDSTVQEGDAQAEVVDQEAEAKLLAYDGRALVEAPAEPGLDSVHTLSYVVHFKLVQWGRSAQGVWSQIVKCIGYLSRERGLSGRFVEIQEDVEEAQDFTLRLVAYRKDSLDNPLHPLTPGQYELQGITIAENAFVYECAVNITLQANGMMSGTSRELPFTQECQLAGMWTRSGVNYLLQYEMHGNKHTYIYFGTPFRSGLQGTWQNSRLRVLEGNLDARTSRAERGILEFQLVKAVRVWSEAFHKDYPAAFRDCVKLLLLASHRDGVLPSHLWSCIVSYCCYDWFRSDLQKSLTRCESKDISGEAADTP